MQHKTAPVIASPIQSDVAIPKYLFYLGIAAVASLPRNDVLCCFVSNETNN